MYTSPFAYLLFAALTNEPTNFEYSGAQWVRAPGKLIVSLVAEVISRAEIDFADCSEPTSHRDMMCRAVPSGPYR
jgi:hypothetical protein